MQELKCPDCGYLNPDIRELGYTLPYTCGKCPHIWRLQDVGPIDAPNTKEEALRFLVKAGIATKTGDLTPAYGEPRLTLSQKMRKAGFTRRPSAKSLPSDE
jgi:hypothetical protein